MILCHPSTAKIPFWIANEENAGWSGIGISSKFKALRHTIFSSIGTKENYTNDPETNRSDISFKTSTIKVLEKEFEDSETILVKL